MSHRRWISLGVALVGVGCQGFFRAETADDALPELHRQAEEIRGLRFSRPVPLEWFTAEDAVALVRAELDVGMPEDETRRRRNSAVAIGLLEPNYPLEEKLIELLSGEVAGLYSLPRRTMYARGSPDSLSAGDKSVVVHELVHALQHEHFPDTIELLTELRHSDDVVAAIRTAIEGDATLAMLGVLPEQAIASADSIRAGLKATYGGGAGPYSAYPRVLSEALIVFPYGNGVAAAARRYAANGNDGLDAWLADPPISTLSFLYPDVEAATHFVDLNVAELAATTGCSLGHVDIVGPLSLRVLIGERLPEVDPDRFLPGWRGDRFAHFECEDGRWESAFVSVWAEEASAAQFVAAFEQLAPELGATRPLSGTPRATTNGTTVVIVTPGAEPRISALFASEVRAYGSLAGWRAEDCFPEGCPAKTSGR